MRVSIVLSALLVVACGGGSGDADRGEADGAPATDAPGERPPSDTDPFDPIPDQPVPEPGPQPEPGSEPDSDPEPGPAPGPTTPEPEPDPEPEPTPEPEPDAILDGVIDSDNYIALTEFAIRMNVLTLTDRAFSPTLFLERFPGNPDEGFASVSEDKIGRVVSDGPCPLGGSYATVGVRETTDIAITVNGMYASCETESGTLDGTYFIASGFGGSFLDDEYDLELSQRDGPDGPGTTAFEARYSEGRFESVSFEVENYSRDTERNPFLVAGSGSRRLDIPGSEDNAGETVLAYDTETTIRLENATGPIELDVATSDLSIARDGPIRGTMTLVAQDGSRVDVGVGDTPDTVSLTLTDPSGAAFTDTVAWQDLYRPPE